mmetsp:Transcript_31984/g.58922  ORF Transcript_31984/g.58922 Transcript_31984/m.58922 type:complete len:150 (-) Transcript_31984:127-576(-)
MLRSIEGNVQLCLTHVSLIEACHLFMTLPKPSTKRIEEGRIGGIDPLDRGIDLPLGLFSHLSFLCPEQGSNGEDNATETPNNRQQRPPTVFSSKFLSVPLSSYHSPHTKGTAIKRIHYCVRFRHVAALVGFPLPIQYALNSIEFSARAE